MEPSQQNEASSAKGKKRCSTGMSSEKKKQKKSKKTRIMTSQEAAVLVPQALLPLVETGFLNTKDLGRLLLRTSKSMTVAGLGEDPDAVWKPLCKSYWGPDEAKNLLETLPLSPKTCFRQLAVMDDHHTKKFEGLRPLQYTPQDYVLIVSIKEHETGKPILWKKIPGQDVAQVFENGKASVILEQPLFENETNPYTGPTGPPAFRPLALMNLSWDGSLHILRLADQRIERFMKHGKRLEQIIIHLDDSNREELCVISHPLYVYPHSRVMGRYGQALFKHYECFDCAFEIDYDLKWDRSGPNKVGIFGFDFCSRIQNPREEGPLRGRRHEQQPFEEAMEGKDVTLAHFLEALME